VSSICVGLQGVTTKFVRVIPIITFKDATKKVMIVLTTKRDFDDDKKHKETNNKP
jgi:hypothetical protein